MRNWILMLEKMISQGDYEGIKSREFLKPYHLITLALLAKKHEVDTVQLSDSIRNYATRMHLWDAAGIQNFDHVQENDCSRSLIPVRAIKTVEDVDGISKAFEVIADHHYPEGQVNDFGTVISELLDNCYRHAEQSEGLYGLSCVQAWRQGNIGQLCIADTGVGIRSALSLNQEYSDRLVNENACRMASELGVSGKLGKGHAGYGLALAKGVIDRNGGKLMIVSGNEGFESHAGEMKEFNLKFAWLGTIVTQVSGFKNSKKYSLSY